MTQCKHSANSELAQLREENEILRQRIDQAQRMTALGELVSTTTHEFNNVLMTILNYAKMGLRHQDPETRTKSFDKILKAGQRAAKITNSVLGMARNRGNQFELTDIPKLIDETMVLLERELQKYKIHVERHVDENTPEVPAIGNQIQQILVNLVINARQAMSDGGHLIIKVGQDAEKQFVDVSVRDYGPGIPQEKLAKIFQPYYTTKDGPDESGKGGTGLGLAACRNIIEAHGGKIRVESAVGKGTCFTIKLPVQKQAPIPAAKGITGALTGLNSAVTQPNG